MQSKNFILAMGVIMLTAALVYSLFFAPDFNDFNRRLDDLTDSGRILGLRATSLSIQVHQLVASRTPNENLDEAFEEIDAVSTVMELLVLADLKRDEIAALQESIDAMTAAMNEFKSVYDSLFETAADSDADDIPDAHRIDELNRAVDTLRQAANDVKLTVTTIMNDVAERSTSTDTTESLDAGH